jgi:aminoglycoside phosphotransferase (APT) family kinase protein
VTSTPSAGERLEVDAGVDLGRLADWMRAAGVGAGRIEEAHRLPGGSQNVLMRLRVDGRDLVLRRPPLHKRANSDETMMREALVLDTLADSDVPHPRLVAACGDPEIIGAAFYLMEHVAGVDVETALGGTSTPTDDGASIGMSIVDSLAALGRVEIGDALEGWRRADWLQRQASRWRSQLQSYNDDREYTGPEDLGDVVGVADWLDAHCPVAYVSGLMHGDFHIDNVLIDARRPVVAAIVDWELATIGDPLLDLAHLLTTWPDGRDGAPMRPALPHLPTRAELVNRYAQVSGRRIDELGWYRTLACFRLGILLEGTKARADAGRAPRDVGDRLHSIAVALLQQARDHLGR